MGELSERSDGDWTDLERGFFEAAPPEIAVPPPPATTFDDLDPATPARVRRNRPARGTRRQGPSRELSIGPSRLARLGGGARRLAWGAWTMARPAAVLVGGWILLGLRLAARRLPPSTHVMKERLERALRALTARIVRDLPERPDGRTLAAAVAALVVVFGVSASVLGSRGPRAASPEPTPEVTIVAPVAAPSVAAPEARPVPDAAARTTLVLPQVRLVAKRHPAKRPAARPAVAARPSAFVRKAR